jgi:hypothetical protein
VPVNAQGWKEFDGNGYPDLTFENNSLALLSVWYFGGTDCRARTDAPIRGKQKVPSGSVSGTH